MDKETLEKLLDGKPPQIKVKAITLYNAAVKNQAAYAKEGTAANRKDWEDAEAALEKLAAQISASADGHDEEDKPLRNIAAVLEYLRGMDWHVTQPSLYRHQKEGKIAPRRDGLYALRDVDRYARTWLKQKSTGKKKREATEDLQRSILEQDRKLRDIKIDREILARNREMGIYIPKELMEVELAARAGILNAGLKHWIQSRAADWIRAGGGDTKHAGELINLMSRDLNEHINSYAAAVEYELVVDAEEEAEEPETDTAEEGETET